ncbi:hypothetical protein J2Z70_001151 [Paenibacillus silagei]|uniref:Uncharacterized protein n=1 Tax=Paenibacillus silagei TaxID=1670801 RepID=A0ABS4NNL7_9BACL|nr:hypothetical protein [Paenibacillus silagei]
MLDQLKAEGRRMKSTSAPEFAGCGRKEQMKSTSAPEFAGCGQKEQMKSTSAPEFAGYGRKEQMKSTSAPEFVGYPKSGRMSKMFVPFPLNLAEEELQMRPPLLQHPCRRNHMQLAQQLRGQNAQ